MYNYIAVRFNSKPCNENITDLIAAFLADEEFESFEPDESGLTAYVRKDKYNRSAVENIIREFPIQAYISFEETEIEGEDWNKEWEKNYFKPILIDDRLVVRSSFHTDAPKAPLEILIDPKMAFGTGHHATTAGMSRMLLEEDIKGKTVIDMGTGTGILAILAKKLGAGKTVGIDIDEFAIENAKENGALNHMEIDWIAGDDKVLKDLANVDIFLANINLNVITGNLSKYLSKLNMGGRIFLSGFLESDRGTIISALEELSFVPIKERMENNWLTLVAQKK